MNTDQLKQQAAEAALSDLPEDTIIGIGTGSTVNYFIDALTQKKHLIQGTVSSSKQSTEKLKQLGIPVYELTTVDEISVYIDGADESNHLLQLIKGGGGALTQEKIIAAVAKKFICIADESKLVKKLGSFPLPVEVIPMARSYVAREIVKLGGDPVYRQGVITDNGNHILDVHHLDILQPIALEESLNQITGVVCNGLFAARGADKLILATSQGIQVMTS